MPKVTYTKAKGLVTETGNGQQTSHALIPATSNAVELSTNTTLTAATHGRHPILCTGAITLTLPAVAIGVSFHLINNNPDGTALTVSPNSSDKFLINAAGSAGTNDKDIVNTGATARRGDSVKLTYGSADGWTILELNGTWADES
tara:strand:+ start:167 stop:601 length:435 start_codon:yes stop_codon:yes gene_type:complete